MFRWKWTCTQDETGMRQNSMKIIGITGGVGSGKSEVLKFLEKNYQATVCEADKMAHKLQMPGSAVMRELSNISGRRFLMTKRNRPKKAWSDCICRCRRITVFESDDPSRS